MNEKRETCQNIFGTAMEMRNGGGILVGNTNQQLSAGMGTTGNRRIKIIVGNNRELEG